MRRLREQLSSEKTRTHELEKKLKDLKSCCNCSRESSEARNLDINSLPLRTSECGSSPQEGELVVYIAFSPNYSGPDSCHAPACDLLQNRSEISRPPHQLQSLYQLLHLDF
ncbi:hypothetical protein ACOSQ3_028634 [Xanthoceras sorbifolium]